MTRATVNGIVTEITEKTVFELGSNRFPDHDIVVVDGVQLIEDEPVKEGSRIYFGKSPCNNRSLDEAITLRCNPSAIRGLKHSTVGIAGCGGLGSNIATYLARSGIRKLIIADFDRVDMSNLNRQNFYMIHLGLFKVHAMAEIIKEINPDVEVEVHPVMLDESNIPEIFGDCDIICEAFDRAEAKAMILSSVAEDLPGIPLVCGSGMAGIDDTDSMTVRQLGDSIYICGDGTSGYSVDAGLMAPRVAVCAGIMANKVLQLLASKKA